MKFPSAHRNHTIVTASGHKKTMQLHRDGSSVWATSGDKNAAFFKADFPSVRSAKAWMEDPIFS